MRGETLLYKVVIAIMFIAFLVFASWIPDFTLDEQECMRQDSNAYIKNLCNESKAN